LALTIYLLYFPERYEIGKEEAATRSSSTVYWLLPALFVLWVNYDSWFILGPFTVALFLGGQILQRLVPVLPGSKATGHLGTLLLVLVVGIAACLLNPHHYHAFALPAQLSWTSPSESFERHNLFAPIYQSLFEANLFQAGSRVATSAFLLLTALGIISFGLNFLTGLQWWRIIIWVAFALLTVYRFRMLAFFAVVAAPITALNFHDFVALRVGRMPQVSRYWMAWSLGGRVASVLIGVALLVAAWPGWLHGQPGDTRRSFRVAWKVESDPAL